MEHEEKVFYSDITRVELTQKNNLHDLLNLTPAKPIPIESSENETGFFEPRCDKYYLPKKRSKLKVRTVREIRNLFEQDNYSYIIEDMEKQQNALLTKIRTGSTTDDSTKNMAKKLINANHPISRTAWQMLNNINPDRNVNPTQFVLWNSRRIRVVGSKGGKTKFICNHDLGETNIEETKKKCCVEKSLKKKHVLLRNSLNIKFKPGPLRRKNNLDDSHQKYQMGPIELVKLPKPALDVQPAYGTAVEPVMSNFLNKLRAEDGTITEKWAELTVSVLGTVKNNNLVQTDKECCVTFDLSYKCNQNRILMRRDISNMFTHRDNDIQSEYALQNDSDNMLEIKNIMNKMLDSVEISLKQDCMYSTVENSPQIIAESLDDSINAKEKNKKKYGELDRLDVTVIQLPGNPKNNSQKPCEKSCCNLGCICDSLNSTYKFKQHCGNSECMFGCKCEFSKYKDIELLENSSAEFIPGLIKIDNDINANLAKEEQKFHQTVVFNGENSILLKSSKRSLKSSTKYAEFYSNMRLKNEQEPKKILTIVSKKLNCSNVEPWCMVHNLFKCFCKGRFTETSALNTSIPLPVTNITADLENSNPSDHASVDTNHDIRKTLRPRVHHRRESSEKRKSLCIIERHLSKDYEGNYSSDSCARTNGYGGRKYDDSYYKTTNHKILDMEKNDAKLHKKMMRLMKNPSILTPNSSGVISLNLSDNSRDLIIESESKNECNDSGNKCNNKKLEMDKNDIELQRNNLSLIENTAKPSHKLSDFVTLDLLNDSNDCKKIPTEPNIPFEISGDIYKPIHGHQITQEFLTPWIAKSYKNYKEQLNNGKSTLERPRKGKIILHLWECLLSRYKSRRNIFLTTTKRPFRIYIATNTWKPFFKDCINIDAIRFADLHKYPSVVKKLLTNATNKNYFCILGGWDDCWEIIGSVKKTESVSDERSCDTDLSYTESLSQDSDFAQENWCVKEQDNTPNSPNVDCLQEDTTNEIKNNNVERSKWFLMKLENDFTEIYCHKKGFYVEREKILHAINLARVTHKTVVINKQTSTEITNIPFGIYALPITTEYCAVVGPYEIDEALGLEIVKASIFIKQNSTKGFWITTNKVDNIKVLDDPMSFLPPKTLQNELCSIIGVKPDDHFKISDDDIDNVHPSTSQELRIKKNKNSDANKETSGKKIPKKMVKPIKIRRTNGFYHLTSNNSIVKKILPKTSASLVNVSKSLVRKTQNQILLNDPLYIIDNQCDIQIMNSGETNAHFTCVEPEAGTSQIKITSVYSENVVEIEKKKNEDKKLGMLILKPEEINKKVSVINNEKKYSVDADEMSMDIEEFLSSPRENSASESDCLLISNEEDEDHAKNDKWTDVWIQCSNINNLGWIRGRRNSDNLLSIDFPGFKTMKLYTESEALNKLNKILPTRINIPENIKLKWQVLTQASKRPKGAPLNAMSMKKQKNDSSISGERCINTVYVYASQESEPKLFEDPPNAIINETSDFIDGLEETSRLLEDQSVLLWNETERRQTEIIRTLSVPEELRSGMSETLQGLMTMNDDLVND